MPSYAELEVTTNFSFLRSASHPAEMAKTAAALGLSAVAVADRNTLAGVVRAHQAAKQAGIKLVVGARLDLQDAPSLLCFPTDRAAYGRLSRLLTLGKRRAEKGQCSLGFDDLLEHGRGLILIALPGSDLEAARGAIARAVRRFPGHVFLGAAPRYDGGDQAWFDACAAAALALAVLPAIDPRRSDRWLSHLRRPVRRVTLLGCLDSVR